MNDQNTFRSEDIASLTMNNSATADWASKFVQVINSAKNSLEPEGNVCTGFKIPIEANGANRANANDSDSINARGFDKAINHQIDIAKERAWPDKVDIIDQSKQGLQVLKTGDMLVREGKTEILIMPNGDTLEVNQDGSFDLHTKENVNVKTKRGVTTLTYKNGDTVDFDGGHISSISRGNLRAVMCIPARAHVNPVESTQRSDFDRYRNNVAPIRARGTTESKNSGVEEPCPQPWTRPLPEREPHPLPSENRPHPISMPEPARPGVPAPEQSEQSTARPVMPVPALPHSRIPRESNRSPVVHEKNKF